MVKYVNNELHIEKVSFSNIAKKYGTAAYVYSKNQIISNLQDYQKALKPVDGLICFACKTNSNGQILKLLAKHGAGADTVSGGEIFRCINAGFAPSKIVFAGVGKTAEEIEYALKNKILMFNVESFEELEAINRIAGKLKTKAKIALRINPDVDPDTHSYVVTGKKGTKFGIPYEEAFEAYLIASKMKNVQPVSIHMHIGSQILEIDSFILAAKKMKKLIDSLEKAGIKPEYINCGGGLGIKYADDTVATAPKRLLSEMFKVFGTGKKFIFEPGRSIIGNTGHLLTKVLYRKISGDKNFLITDAAMNDLIRPTLYNAYHDIVPVKRTAARKVKTDVVGPICESGDFMGKDRMLPVLDNGELLLVKNAGAYGAAMASEYNSRPFLPEILVDGNKTYLIRKRATYKDLILNEI
ncbi:MAG: diaminopimelate decarboxylase [Endomicrobia bacterium]|nr:diaminopimelate decarboxylase [Endomicrobiia bacterium]